MTTRRLFLTGMGATILGAPAIVRASSLMTLPRQRLPIGPPFSPMADWRQLTEEEILADMREMIAHVTQVPAKYLYDTLPMTGLGQ